MKFLIGTDPEIFINNNDGTLASSIGIFEGTKEEPVDIGNGCFLQQDNILVEFNIPPTDNFEGFSTSINYCKDYIEAVLIPLGKELHYSSSELATEEVLSDPDSLVFGCSPSYNVITETLSEVDIETFTPIDKMIRSSGFHIHIGYDDPTEEMNDRIVLCFEAFVTLPLIDMDNDMYNRRKLYGLIGDSRSKEYGVECRSLGGYFLKDDETLKIVWDKIQEAMDFVSESPLTNSEIKEMLLECIDVESNTIINSKVNSTLSKLKECKLKTI